MTIKLSAVSGKGGAGKTTLVILIAGEFAIQKKKVLLIDADNRQNLAEWWKRCEAKDNLPAGIDLQTASTQRGIEQILRSDANRYDVVIMDTPGIDTSMRDLIIRESHAVLTPIQPNQDEIKAAGEAAEAIGVISDETGRSIPQFNIVTRITLPGRALEAYRLIRPFVENLQEAGYDSHLLGVELLERNCYREIRNGYGTLQMLDLTEPVMKGRKEVQELVSLLSEGLFSESREAVNG